MWSIQPGSLVLLLLVGCSVGGTSGWSCKATKAVEQNTTAGAVGLLLPENNCAEAVNNAFAAWQEPSGIASEDMEFGLTICDDSNVDFLGFQNLTSCKSLSDFINNNKFKEGAAQLWTTQCVKKDKLETTEDNYYIVAFTEEDDCTEALPFLYPVSDSADTETNSYADNIAPTTETADTVAECGDFKDFNTCYKVSGCMWDFFFTKTCLVNLYTTTATTQVQANSNGFRWALDAARSNQQKAETSAAIAAILIGGLSIGGFILFFSYKHRHRLCPNSADGLKQTFDRAGWDADYDEAAEASMGISEI